MFISKRMVKLNIAGPKSVMECVIKGLHQRKVIHIVDHVKNEDIDIGSPIKDSPKVSEVLIRIRSLLSHLKVIPDNKYKSTKLMSFSEIESFSRETLAELNEILRKSKETDEILKEIRSKKDIIEKLKVLPLPIDAYTDYNSIVCFIGTIEEHNDIKKEIRGITENFEFYSLKGKKPMIALFVEAEKKEDVQAILSKHSFSELNISSVKGMGGTAEENLRDLTKKEGYFAERKQKLNSQIAQMSKKHSASLIASEDILSKELERLQAPLRFAATKNTFVIRGWVPMKQLKPLQEDLMESTKNKIYIETEELKKGERIPVELDNPKPVKPFEFFMDLYTLPRYNEIDPTFLVFLIFPLLFGFMLGDMGYGVITLIAALLLKKKMPNFKRFFNIFIFSSVATIFFGALFGEVFGEEEIFGVALPHIFSRAHQLDILISVAITVGIFHLLAGYIIGFINIYKGHGLKHAVYEKAGWILLFPAVVRIILMLNLINGGIGNFLSLLMPHDYVIIFLAVIGVILILIGEGFIGTIEIPGLFSNILSYARLMAIGLASVQLALVVNEFVKEFFHAGGFMIIAAIALLIFGHLLNIALGWLGCFLHSLRLHYVEFFTKFFKGGAPRFTAFGAKD